MIETPRTSRERAAIEAAHQARGAMITGAFAWLFGRKG